MRRNHDYLACCENGGKGPLERLYKDFGDVRDDSFKKWWTEDGRGGNLFAENRGALKLMELEDKQQWDDAWSKDEVLILAVPLTSSKRYLQSRFARILKKRHPTEKPGRPMKRLSESNANYPLERNYTIRNLETTLMVYDEYMKYKDQKPKVPLWKIGENLTLIKTSMTTPDMSQNERQVFRNSMGASVKRYITNAERMIANTALGRFPLTKDVV